MDASSMGIEAICDGLGSLVKARLIVECNVKSLKSGSARRWKHIFHRIV